MASKEFKKSDIEFSIFKDIYELTQKHYIPEARESAKCEEYWQELIKDIDAFVLKHKNHLLAVHLSLALIKYAEEVNEMQEKAKE